MRALGGGTITNTEKKIFPSLQTCNQIKNNDLVQINGIQHTWRQIKET
jgi:hypothetical protein